MFVFLLFYSALSQMNPTRRTFILNAHNGYRGNVTAGATNMIKLRYDMTLECVAQRYLESLTSSSFKHNPNRTSDWSTYCGGPVNVYVGENWYSAGPGPDDSFGGATYMWCDYVWGLCSERAAWEKTCFDVNNVTGHYTQVVWANSAAVGCGFVSGKGTLCNYAPGGNYVGQQPFIVGTSCSACPTGYTCDSTGKLCVAPSCTATSCGANGACNTTTGECDCNNGYYLSQGTCVACVANCASCTAKFCRNCNAGYFTNSLGACQACGGTNCPTSIFTASSCAGTSNGCSACPTGWVCVNGVTTTCATGYWLSGTSCLPCSTTCPSGTFQSSTCTATADRVCTPCGGACLTGKFLSSACNATADRVCTDCTVCGAYLTQCTATADATCLACPACPTDNYQSAPCIDANTPVCSPCTVGVCPTGSYQSAACSPTADRVCTPCGGACATGTFLSSACTDTADRVCTPCSGACPTGSYQSSACSTTADRVCLACSGACPSGSYQSSSCTATADRVCLPCSGVCPTGSYQSATCSATADRVCLPCGGACPTGSYQASGCTSTANRVCTTCGGACPAGTYQSSACTSTANRVCTTCSTCPAGTFVSTACTSTQNTGCTACSANCLACTSATSCSTCATGYYRTTSGTCVACTTTPCPSGSYQSAACSATADRVCTACTTTACASGTYLSSPCSATANRVCSPCSTCATGQYIVSSCTSTANTVCAACTTCPSGTTQVSACTSTADRVCNVAWMFPSANAVAGLTGFELNPTNAYTSGTPQTWAVDASTAAVSLANDCAAAAKDRHDFFGFSIPAAVSSLSIRGIEVSARIKVSSTSNALAPKTCFQVSADGGVTWGATTLSTPNLGTTAAGLEYVVGGRSNLWGLTNPSTSNFRIRVTNSATSAKMTFSLDYVAVRFYY